MIFLAQFVILNLSEAQAIIDHELIQSFSQEELTSMSILPARGAVDALRVNYITQGSNGMVDTASGLVLLPEDKNTNRLLSYQYGDTDGLDQTPSALNPEGILGALYAGQGYVVCLTDYLGHGESRGFHPYLHAETEARAALDLLLGTRSFAGEQGFNHLDQIFLTGYSQGGHATMALAQAIEERETDDLWITASACNAGPYDLSGVMRELLLQSDSSYRVPAFVPYNIIGYQTIYGDIYQDLADVFKNNYLSPIISFSQKEISRNDLNEQLVAELMQAQGDIIPRAMLQDDYLEAIQMDTLDPLNVAQRENDTYRWIPDFPMRLFYCSGDAQVPAENSLVAAAWMNARNANDVQAVEASTNASHDECVLPTVLATLAYFATFTTTSVQHVDIDRDLAYPNPSPGHVQILNVQDRGVLEVYDMTGHLLLQQEVLPDQVIDLGHLESSTYYLRYREGSQFRIGKLVVLR